MRTLNIEKALFYGLFRCFLNVFTKKKGGVSFSADPTQCTFRVYHFPQKANACSRKYAK